MAENNSYFKSTTLTLLFLSFLLLHQASWGQDPYPDINASHTKIELDSLLGLFQKKKDTLGMGYTYYCLARLDEKATNLNNSLITNLRKSMECFQVTRHEFNFYNARGAIGTYFMERPFMKELAKDYIESAIYYFRASKHPETEIGHLINLANIYIHENNFGPAKEILDRVELLNQTLKDKAIEGRWHSSYSDYYSRQQHFEEALKHCEKSYDIGKSEQMDWLEAVSLYIKSTCYEALNNKEARFEALMAASKIVENNGNLYQLRKEIYNALRDHYIKQKNYPMAYEFANKTQMLISDIYFSKIEGDMRSFSEYNLLEKQKIIVAKIELEKKLAQAEVDTLRTRQQTYIGIIVFGVLAILAVFIYYNNRQKINQLEINQTKDKNKIETLNHLINGQELERERIAQELHDGLGTMLSRMKIMVENDLPIERIHQLIDDACAEVRTISRNLQPNALANFGLIGALQDFASKHSDSKPVVIFQHFGTPANLDVNKNLMVFRIIQELVTNAIKHAQATEILVQIIFTSEDITITVEDDGIGFDETKINHNANGWNNIKSRVSLLHGHLQFHSEPQKGTSVTIVLQAQVLTTT
jgi:signal transduction histidine kinase